MNHIGCNYKNINQFLRMGGDKVVPIDYQDTPIGWLASY